MKEVIVTDQAPRTKSPLSQAIRASGFVFVSGQIGLDPVTGQLVEGGIAAQTEQTLKNIEVVLNAAGSDLSKVVKATVYLTDLDERDEMNQVYSRFFADRPPARAAVQVSRLVLGARVEIEVVALA